MFAIEATSSALAYCSLALFLGCLITAGFLLPRGEPTEFRGQLYSFALKLLPLFVIASIISLLIQGTKLNGGAFPTVDLLHRYLFFTQSGKIWTVREIYALLLLGGMFWYGQKQHNLRASPLPFPIIAPRRQPQFYKPRRVSATTHGACGLCGCSASFRNRAVGRRATGFVLGSFSWHAAAASCTVLGRGDREAIFLARFGCRRFASDNRPLSELDPGATARHLSQTTGGSFGPREDSAA